jgi:thiol-disulfide isomerase/thioredoxin
VREGEYRIVSIPDEGPAVPTTPPPGAETPVRRTLQSRLVLALAVGAALAALFWPRGDGRREIRPGGFLIDAAGRPQPLARELKPVTLLHFWATWCPPCITEIPSLVEYATTLRDGRVGLVLVAVDDDPERARTFLGTAEFPLLYDPDWDVAHRFGTRQLPETHIVVEGRVVDSFIGAADWRDPQVRARVQKWTATPPSAMP